MSVDQQSMSVSDSTDSLTSASQFSSHSAPSDLRPSGSAKCLSYETADSLSSSARGLSYEVSEYSSGSEKCSSKENVKKSVASRKLSLDEIEQLKRSLYHRHRHSSTGSVSSTEEK